MEALVTPSSPSPPWPLTLGDRLVEAEINPVFVLPEGQGVRAADGLVVLAMTVIQATPDRPAAGALR